MNISDHCYALTGLSAIPPWTVNAGFVVGEHTTCIIDTGSNFLTAQTIAGYAQSLRVTNHVMVVNTEAHFDHIGGNHFFRARGIDVYGHPEMHRTPAEFQGTQEAYNATIPDQARRIRHESDAFFLKTALANPNKPLIAGEAVDLGHVWLTAIATPGHTPWNMSVYVEPDGVLYCGDCLVSTYYPNLEAGHAPEWHQWLHSLDQLEALMLQTIVPGHGDVIPHQSIPEEFTRLRTILHEALAQC